MTVNPNQHKRIRADLKAFADGELSPLARFFVARHLRGCPSCREELIQMQTLSTELRESDTEVQEMPLSSDLRAHILESAPITETDAIPEEEFDPRPQRVARKKMVLALGVTSILAVMALTTITGSKVKNTFNKAADSMNTATDSRAVSAGSFPSSAGPGQVQPPANFPSAGSAIPGAAPVDAPTLRNETQSNGMFSDGRVKARSDDYSVTLKSAARGNATDEITSVNGAALGQSQNSVSSSGPLSVVPTTRAVHREGSISVAVQNAESAGDEAASIIKNAGGFIADTSLETGAGQKRTAVLDCRIPVNQFETAVKKISALGTVRAKSLSGQDITAQIARSGARRQTLAQELSIAQARLAKIEKLRKPNANDLYQLRAEVRTIRMQAAQSRAALETLQKYGSLSSLYVSLQDGILPATPKAAGWFDSLSPSSQAAWNSFLNNARLPLQLLLWVLAYSPLWLPALIIWHKYGRKWLTQ